MSLALLLADSGSGISMALDPRQYMFINVDLTVVVHRDPHGDCLLLDSVSSMGGTGAGLAETQLYATRWPAAHRRRSADAPGVPAVASRDLCGFQPQGSLVR